MFILLHVSQLWASSELTVTRNSNMPLGNDALPDVKRDTDVRMPPGSYRAPGFQGGKRDTASDTRMPPGSYRVSGYPSGKRHTTFDTRVPPGS